MKRFRTLGRAITLGVLLIPLALYGTKVWSQPTAGTTKSKKAPAPGAKWQSYVNKKYGVRFLYPRGSTVENRNDTNYKYIRVQNYECSYKKVLKPSEFYLEVFIIDPALGHHGWEPCEDAV